MDNDPLLHLHNISKFFGGIVALDQLTLSVQRGQVIGIVGPNSSGKTTLLDVINGIQQADNGTMTFSGHDITHCTIHERAQLGITRTFKLPRLFPHLNVVDHLVMCQPKRFTRFWQTLARYPVPTDATLQTLIDNLHLTPYCDVPVSELPLERQKCLELAMAIIAAPHLLLLDEITAGCANDVQDLIQQHINRLKQSRDITMILVEHNLQLVRAVCDWLLIMNYGQIVAQGAPEDILTDEILLQTFFTM